MEQEERTKMILLKLHFYEARAIFKCQILVNLNFLKEARNFTLTMSWWLLERDNAQWASVGPKLNVKKLDKV